MNSSIFFPKSYRLKLNKTLSDSEHEFFALRNQSKLYIEKFASMSLGSGIKVIDNFTEY